MYGMTGVEVKTGVGDAVAEGVTLGVNVGPGVAVSTKPTGTPARDVSVAPEIMVDMTAVSRKWRSCVGAGRLGAQAWETINKTVTDKRMGVDFRIIGLLSVIKAIIRPKRGIIRQLRDVRLAGLVPIFSLSSLSNPQACSWI